VNITGTHIAYLLTCERKLWLFARHIRMEQTSVIVEEGKVIGETTYNRRAEKFTELEVDGSKIDFFDFKKRVIHEVKKSNKVEKAHVAQVLYYIYLLNNNGINNVTARIEYPKLKETRTISMTDDSHENVQKWIKEAHETIKRDSCPPLLNKPICKSCSYFEFCYSGDD
jgi:CRISPR-associated exonuclease Cas4